MRFGEDRWGTRSMSGIGSTTAGDAARRWITDSRFKIGRSALPSDGFLRGPLRFLYESGGERVISAGLER